jgi:hypothetical protein
MPQDLAQRSASSPEDVQIAGMDVLVQGLLHLQSQRNRPIVTAVVGP